MSDRPDDVPVESVSLTEKEREFLRTTWKEQRTEWSKATLALSSAAIGLIFAAVLGRENLFLPWFVLVVLLIALLSFAVALAGSVAAYKSGADLTGAQFKEQRDEVRKHDRRLKCYGHAQTWGLWVGLICLVGVPTLHIFQQLLQKCL